MSWFSFRSYFGPIRRPIRPQRRTRLGVERLEDRTTPSRLFLTGAPAPADPTAGTYAAALPPANGGALDGVGSGGVSSGSPSPMLDGGQSFAASFRSGVGAAGSAGQAEGNGAGLSSFFIVVNSFGAAVPGRTEGPRSDKPYSDPEGPRPSVIALLRWNPNDFLGATEDETNSDPFVLALPQHAKLETQTALVPLEDSVGVAAVSVPVTDPSHPAALVTRSEDAPQGIAPPAFGKVDLLFLAREARGGSDDAARPADFVSPESSAAAPSNQREGVPATPSGDAETPDRNGDRAWNIFWVTAGAVGAFSAAKLLGGDGPLVVRRPRLGLPVRGWRP